MKGPDLKPKYVFQALSNKHWLWPLFFLCGLVVAVTWAGQRPARALRLAHEEAETLVHFMPAVYKEAAFSPVTATLAWSADGQGNPTSAFSPGEPIRYYVSGSNDATLPLDVDFTYELSGTCGVSTVYSSTLPVEPGEWTKAYTGTAPYCTGAYTYTAQVAYNKIISRIDAALGVTAPITVSVREQPAFDKCRVASVGDMQTWWNASPYRVANVYIGGISLACANTNLTPEWVAAVRDQGWALIPTWVGPQAPCSDFRHLMSDDPAVTYQQGRSEAEAAVMAAANLGLTRSGLNGTIIYYDMEAYPGKDNPECRQAVGSFVSGWVERMHELGNPAGVYGSPCSTYVSEWAVLPNVPDDVWLASWYTDEYDPDANVWDMPCLSTSLWADHQRIRQYAGSHSETWGGLQLTIDSNVTDGEVLAPTQGSRAAFPGHGDVEIGLALPDITDMQFLSPGQGWALADRHALWTADGGLTWADLAPAISPVYAAFFLEARQGWLVAGSPAPSGAVGFQILHTADGGGSWEAYPWTTWGEQDGVPTSWPVSLQFIDAQRGWMALKLTSSSNFNRGLLYRTEDGGRTWQQLALPAGERVHFVSAEEGWTTGGVQGHELYHTRDGGFTWESQAVVSLEPGIPDQVYYDLPTFADLQNGVLPVTVADPHRPRLEFYRTRDGGMSWSLAAAYPLAPGAPPGEKVPVAVLGPDHWIVVDPGTGSLSITADGGATWRQPGDSALAPGVVQVRFITPELGWTVTRMGTCSGEKASGGAGDLFRCTVHTRLWRTGDGGEMWEEIELGAGASGY